MPLDRLAALRAAQCGVLRIDQLGPVGVSRSRVRAQVAAGRWELRSATVLTDFTGIPTPEQNHWIAVLNGGPTAILGGLAAAELAGLRNWHRETLTVFVPYEAGPPATDLPDVSYVRTRRPLALHISRRPGPPSLRLEPAVLLWAATQRNQNTIEGLLAACIQQRLTDDQQLLEWLDRLSPLPRAPLMRTTLHDLAGGVHSRTELDLKRLLRTHRLEQPARQVRRRDATGRNRYTDAEWRLPDGTILHLEIDGSFHMEVAQWEDDIARQRALTTPGKVTVHCTRRDLRDGHQLVADLRRLGVPRLAS